MSLYHYVVDKVKKSNQAMEVAKERLDTCKACKFYQPTTKTCGDMVTGNTVKYNKKEIHLCGCIMPIKTLLPLSTCPANKWKTEMEVEAVDIEEIKEALAAYDKAPTNADTIRRINVLYKKSCGARCRDINPNDLHCGACVVNRIKDIRAYVKRVDRC